MILGIIADDLTGGSDAASFASQAGLSTLLLNQIPQRPLEQPVDVVVIAQKTRAMPAADAVAEVHRAFDWLKANNCQQFYFKYCSTFDSSALGNIGPVTDALLQWLNLPATVLCPALPVNGRTVYQGYLFVHHQLLAESGMKDHPLTPMRDSSLLRLMAAQAHGKVGLLSHELLELGRGALLESAQQQRAVGVRYLVCDVISDNDLALIAGSFIDWPLLTGGSGLVGAIASQHAQNQQRIAKPFNFPCNMKGVVIAGSCSQQTLIQVDSYRREASYLALNIEQLMSTHRYLDEVIDWVCCHQAGQWFPLVFASAPAERRAQIQQRWGSEQVSSRIEQFNCDLASALAQRGIQTFIVAGGETSGAVGQALDCQQLEVGPTIAPGVPWLKARERERYVAFKSGNFGDEDFFFRAQQLMRCGASSTTPRSYSHE